MSGSKADEDVANVFGLLLLMPYAAWAGFVVLKLYRWFVLPAWPTMPPLGVWHVAGLMLLVSTVRLRVAAKDDRNILEQILKGSFALLVGLGLGALYRAFAF